MFGLVVNGAEWNKMKWNEVETEWKLNFIQLFGYFMKCFYSIAYTPNWSGRKMRENDRMRWNEYYHIQWNLIFHSTHF
jgi:hypothetical protein